MNLDELMNFFEDVFKEKDTYEEERQKVNALFNHYKEEGFARRTLEFFNIH